MWPCCKTSLTQLQSILTLLLRALASVDKSAHLVWQPVCAMWWVPCAEGAWTWILVVLDSESNLSDLPVPVHSWVGLTFPPNLNLDPALTCSALPLWSAALTPHSDLPLWSAALTCYNLLHPTLFLHPSILTLLPRALAMIWSILILLMGAQTLIQPCSKCATTLFWTLSGGCKPASEHFGIAWPLWLCNNHSGARLECSKGSLQRECYTMRLLLFHLYITRVIRWFAWLQNAEFNLKTTYLAAAMSSHSRVRLLLSIFHFMFNYNICIFF